MNTRSILQTLGTPSEDKKDENRKGQLTYKKNRSFHPPITINGVDISGGDVDEAFVSFTPGSPGKWVIIGEIPLRPRELAPISRFILTKIGATVTAIHNHWIVDGERIMYLHFQLAIDHRNELPYSLLENINYLWNYL